MGDLYVDERNSPPVVSPEEISNSRQSKRLTALGREVVSVRVLDEKMGEMRAIEGAVVRRVRSGEGPVVSQSGVFAQRERAEVAGGIESCLPTGEACNSAGK